MKTGIVILSVLALGVMLWLAFPGKKPEPPRTGVLAELDLDAGHYVLLFSLGEPNLRAHPQAPLVRVVDDQALIARHRNGLDVRHGLSDFLPAEGRPTDIFLYVYRDGEKVAGQRVTQAERVSIPPALYENSRVARWQEMVADQDEIERQRAALVTQGALVAMTVERMLVWVDLQESLTIQ